MTKTKIMKTIVLGGILSFALPFFRSDWSISTFCDGFSLVGVLFLSYVGLQFLHSQDAFFGLQFLLKRIKSYWFPFMNGKEQEGSVKRQAKRNVEKSVLVVGLGYLGIALIFLFFI